MQACAQKIFDPGICIWEGAAMKAEEYLNQVPMWAKEKNSLEDIRRFLEYLGNPDRKIPVIHVAGTNGKGSVCACLTYALGRAGYRVGTFVSPHLVELRERFLLDGKMAEEGLFEECFCQVKEAADVLADRGLRHPTFFEFLFYMAAVLFAKAEVDFWIMETGLGGRLDATNAVEHPLISVITSISLDHTQYLGSTIREIAGEKAGIIKEGVTVIYDANNREAAQVISAQAKRLKAKAVPLCRQDFQERHYGKGRIALEFKGGTPKVFLPFKASYQADNGALAWRTLQVLMEEGRIEGEREGCLLEGMAETCWPGRMEEVLPRVFVDGAHNPGGMEAFVRAAKEEIKGKEGKIFVLFAAAADKDYRNMVQYLWRGLKPDLAVAVQLQSERGLKIPELKKLLRQEMGLGCSAECFEKTGPALEYLLRKQGSGDYIFCAGSLYLIGEIKQELLGRRGHD